MFKPPIIEAETDIRTALLAYEKFQKAGGGAYGNFGYNADDTARDHLAALRESLRILVLEDQPMNQLVIERQLTRLGLRHDLVENGVLGLRRLEEARYNLVLCDCSMPQMDGFEFTRAVRLKQAKTGEPRIPVIALTANAFTEDVERCQAAGMDDFLSKPVKLENLADKIVTWGRVGLAASGTMTESAAG